MQSSTQHAHRTFKERNGTLRTCEALRAGIHPRSLYEMRDRGEIEQIARGLFRLAVSASVLQRLLNLSRQSGRSFNELAQFYEGY